MFQENLSNIEPDHSFEFQKEIENFCNRSGNLSLDNSIQSEKKQQHQTVSSPNKNMVMIDQEALMELIQAKQILDAQKYASKVSQPVNVESIMSTAFGSALFSTPQNQEKFSSINTPSTKESSQGSQDQIQSVMKFNEIATQEKTSGAKFTGSIFSNDQLFSKHRLGINLNLTNTVKLDSKFNKDFIEDVQDSKADNSILGTSAYGRAIGNDLLNIIDCDSSVNSIKQESPKAGLCQNFQNFNLNNSPISNEHSNQSSNSTAENSGSSASNDQPEFSSIFTQQAMYMPPAPTYMSKAAINAPAFVPSGSYFKPAAQVKEFIPTQIDAQELQKSSKGRYFDFPEGGWECSKCQNYNFKGREQCHRCKKDKCDEDYQGKPKHMSTAKFLKKQNYKLRKLAEFDTQSATLVQKETEEVNASSNGSSDDNTIKFANKWASQQDYKVQKEKRVITQQDTQSDGWTCQRCANHNFGSRETCNICYMGQPYQQNFGQPQPMQQQCFQEQAPPMQNYQQPQMGRAQIQVTNYMQQQVLNFNQQFPAL